MPSLPLMFPAADSATLTPEERVAVVQELESVLDDMDGVQGANERRQMALVLSAYRKLGGKMEFDASGIGVKYPD